MKRFLLFAAALLVTAVPQFAQDGTNIPEDVFYLMPSFGKGIVSFKSKPSAQGTLNICAVDGSVRFKDASGQEMELDDVENVTQVAIDGVTFIHSGGAFWRVYPISNGAGLAQKREVSVITDSRNTAYGGTSQTTAVTEYTSVITSGIVVNLDNVRDFPYREKVTVNLVKDGAVMSPTKKNFQKCFPDRKADIEAWFKANKKAPTDFEGLDALCRQWAD